MSELEGVKVDDELERKSYKTRYMLTQLSNSLPNSLPPLHIASFPFYRGRIVGRPGVSLDDLVYITTKLARQMDASGMDKMFQVRNFFGVHKNCVMLQISEIRSIY